MNFRAKVRANIYVFLGAKNLHSCAVNLVLVSRNYTVLSLIHCQHEFRVWYPYAPQNSNCAELFVHYLFAHLKEDGEQREGHERHEHRVVLRALLSRVVVDDGVHSCARNTNCNATLPVLSDMRRLEIK